MVNEKRLIDANALMDAIEVTDWYHISPKGYLQKGANSQIHTPLFKTDDIFQALKDAPTVDAVEVVHSKWDTVFYERNGTLASYSHICPECKYFYRDLRFKGHNYCPNCGADMRGETE